MDGVVPVIVQGYASTMNSKNGSIHLPDCLATASEKLAVAAVTPLFFSLYLYPAEPVGVSHREKKVVTRRDFVLLQMNMFICKRTFYVSGLSRAFPEKQTHSSLLENGAAFLEI